MKSKDQLLLEEAYNAVNEGIWDRLKGIGSGMKAGIKQGAQNLSAGVASKFGADVKPSKQTMGQAYAKSQQKSIFNSFLNKAKKEIADFENDIQKLGNAEIAQLKKSHPEIEEKIKQIKQLLVYLGGQTANINKIK